MKKYSLFLAVLLLSVPLFSQTKTGTLKIFSELTGIVVYLDEIRHGEDIQQIDDVPIGSHYLKVMLDGVSVYGELIGISESTITTVLIKNTGQVQEKILESKTAEQQEYTNNRLDIILSSGMSTTTKSYSNLFPGYYGYWGTSNAVTTSVETIDWKIIQGGVKEINESTFANITENLNLQQAIADDWNRYNKLFNTSAIIAVATLIPAFVIFADLIDSKPTSFLLENNLEGTGMTERGTNMQVGFFVGTAVPAFFSTTIALKYPEPSGHNISVEDAAKEAQNYNRKMKKKLGLPENYDIK